MYIIDKKNSTLCTKPFFAQTYSTKKRRETTQDVTVSIYFFIDFFGSLFLGAWIVENLMLGSYAETASQFRIDVLRVQRCAEAI